MPRSHREKKIIMCIQLVPTQIMYHLFISMLFRISATGQYRPILRVQLFYLLKYLGNLDTVQWTLENTHYISSQLWTKAVECLTEATNHKIHTYVPKWHLLMLLCPKVTTLSLVILCIQSKITKRLIMSFLTEILLHRRTVRNHFYIFQKFYMPSPLLHN